MREVPILDEPALGSVALRWATGEIFCAISTQVIDRVWGAIVVKRLIADHDYDPASIGALWSPYKTIKGYTTIQDSFGMLVRVPIFSSCHAINRVHLQTLSMEYRYYSDRVATPG